MGRDQIQPGDLLLSPGTSPTAGGGWTAAVPGIHPAGGDPEPGEIPGGGSGQHDRAVRECGLPDTERGKQFSGLFQSAVKSGPV